MFKTRLERQDLAVLLIDFLGYPIFRNLSLRIQKRPVTRFLIMHDILPETSDAFEAKIRMLKTKMNVVSLDDYFQGRLDLKKPNVVITFDDGYKGWITHALPKLKTHHAPAAFFISSGFVGLSKNDEAEFTRTKLFLKMGPRMTTGGLSIDDVKTIADAGYIVGGHTANHLNLSESPDEERAKREIMEDKAKIESILGKKIDYFAYPSGVFKHPRIDLKKILKESGYKGALTTVSGPNTSKTDPYLLHREITEANMPARLFEACARGNLEAIRIIKTLARGRNL